MRRCDLKSPTRPPPIIPTSVALTPLGYVDHSAYGANGVRLVYGELGDGRLVRVDQLVAGSKPWLICPVCRTDVHLVRRQNAQLFFRHSTGAPGCCGPETNAHIWAKEQLLQAKKIWLPAVMSTFPGIDQELQESRWFNFARVELEPSRGDLRPDLAIQVERGDGAVRELWIEIHVTNPCKLAKIQKIKALRQPTIEIDLSDYRTSKDEAEIRAALLEGAGRSWLYHKAVEEDLRVREARERAALARTSARERAEAESLILASRKVSAAEPSSSLKAILSKIEVFGLQDAVGISTRLSGFCVDAHYWQAALLDRLVVNRMEAGHPVAILRPVDALKVLVDCLPAEFQSYVSPNVLHFAREIDPTFIAPQVVILHYFRALTRARVLVAGEFPKWHLAQDRAVALQRKIVDLRYVRDQSERATGMPMPKGSLPKDMTLQGEDRLARATQTSWPRTAEIDVPAKQAKKPKLNLAEVKRRARQIFDDLPARLFINSGATKLNGAKNDPRK